MGEHKHNPTAIAAKMGFLQPKKRKVSKREASRILERKFLKMFFLDQFYDAMKSMEEQDG